MDSPMHILYVTPYVPSRIRTRPYHFIRTLIGQGHTVTLLTAAGTSSAEQAEIEELRAWGISVEVFPVPFTRSLFNCLLAFPSRQPLQAAYAYHPQMAARLRTLALSETFDIVHIEHLRAARLVRAVPTTIPVVYDSVDCIALLFEQAAERGTQWRSRLIAALDLPRTRQYEARLTARFNQVVVTSRRDQRALEHLARHYLPSGVRPAPITVVTNGVDLNYFRPPESEPRSHTPPTIVLTGKMSYHANVAAARYFAQDVLPRIWQQLPDVRFQIVGKDPPEMVRQLAKDARIEVTGTVADLRPYLARADVAVCPARYAVGIQNKVLEAMAMGTPVVSSSAGAPPRAIEERSLLVADDEADFSQATLRILTDPLLASRLSRQGRRYVETHHNWEVSTQNLTAVYQAALSAGER